MVTTTTKTLNYSITKGNTNNSVNATITSTPGFNSNYLGKVAGILKLLQLALAIAALVMIATLRMEMRPVTRDAGTIVNGTEVPIIVLDNNGNPVPAGSVRLPPSDSYTRALSYNREAYLNGEVYFLCAHTAAITVLVIFLVAYLFHTTSAMIIPKATTLENVANLLLALLLLAAGIVLIVQTIGWGSGVIQSPDGLIKGADGFSRWKEVPNMPPDNAALRFAAAALAIINALLLIGSFVLSRKDLAGPKTGTL